MLRQWGGVKTFPNFNNRWTFEDKVAQKYLLEAIDAPVVKSWAFYELDRAIEFLKTANYPIVAKLKKGAGSNNVVLLKDYKSALKYTKDMFSKGAKPSQGIAALSKGKAKQIASGKKINLNIIDLLKKLRVHLSRRKRFAKEIGYVYFQKFLPNNKRDLRIAVVGDRAWGFYRGVRKNDFRASGSGVLDYNTPLDLDCIKKSFEVTKRLGTQSLCFDYVQAPDGSYQIVEICYGYVSKAIYDCAGYYDPDLTFHEGHFYPEECILDDFLKS